MACGSDGSQPNGSDSPSPSGALDETFGVEGRYLAPADLSTAGTSLALTRDEGIVVGGHRRDRAGSPARWYVTRLTPDGKPIDDFNERIAAEVAQWYGEVSRVAAHADGSVWLAGSLRRPTDQGFALALARVTSRGALDSDFGSAGLIRLPQSEAGDIVALMPTRKGVITAVQTPAMLRLSEYLPDGTPSQGFGDNGELALPIRYGTALADTQGRVLVYGPLGLAERAKVQRFTSEGQSDPSFGTGGTVSLDRWVRDLPRESRTVNAVTVDQLDRVVVSLAGASHAEQRLIRLTHDGKPDSRFGSNGELRYRFTAGVSDITTDDENGVFAVAKSGEANLPILMRVLRTGRRDPRYLNAEGRPAVRVTTGLKSANVLDVRTDDHDRLLVVGHAGDEPASDIATDRLFVARYR